VAELAEQLGQEAPHTSATSSSRGGVGGVWPSSTKWPFLMQVSRRGSHHSRGLGFRGFVGFCSGCFRVAAGIRAVRP
jgi:hypothetical protein